MSWTREHFDGIADRYDALLPEHVQEHYRKKRVRLIGRLLAGGTALDVGCGTGLLMAALRPYGTVLGVDESAGMIAVLRSSGRGEAVVASSERLPFADNRFDVVFSVAVLHHIADAARVRNTIREMVRVTRPDGRVVIWDHNPKNPYWPHLMRRSPQDTGRERLVPAAEIERTLHECGVRQATTTQSGFVPEFAPAWLMPLARLVEAALERAPLVRRWGAHNVIVAVK